MDADFYSMLRQKITNERGELDPLRFAKIQWPAVEFYDKQREVIDSVERNKQTYVVAGNMLGV